MGDSGGLLRVFAFFSAVLLTRSPSHQATYTNEGYNGFGFCASEGQPQTCTITNPDLPGGIHGIIPQQQFFQTTAAAVAGAAWRVWCTPVATPSYPPPGVLCSLWRCLCDTCDDWGLFACHGLRPRLRRLLVVSRHRGGCRPGTVVLLCMQ